MSDKAETEQNLHSIFGMRNSLDLSVVSSHKEDRGPRQRGEVEEMKLVRTF